MTAKHLRQITTSYIKIYIPLLSRSTTNIWFYSLVVSSNFSQHTLLTTHLLAFICNLYVNFLRTEIQFFLYYYYVHLPNENMMSMSIFFSWNSVFFFNFQSPLSYNAILAAIISFFCSCLQNMVLWSNQDQSLRK